MGIDLRDLLGGSAPPVTFEVAGQLNVGDAIHLSGVFGFERRTGESLMLAGNAAIDVAGAVIAKGDFELAFGEVSSAALPSGATQDADAMVLTLTNVGVFVGVGGSLSDTTDGEANNTPNDYSDDEVVDGTLGFGATVSKLTLVSIKDRGAMRRRRPMTGPTSVLRCKTSTATWWVWTMCWCSTPITWMRW